MTIGYFDIFDEQTSSIERGDDILYAYRHINVHLLRLFIEA